MTIARDYYLNRLIEKRGNRRIKVITGIRRCGKSVLLFELFRSYLKSTGVTESQVIELHLDEDENVRYRNPMELGEHLRSLIGKKRKQLYVLIDEIQEVKPIQNPWLSDDKEAKITFVDVLLGLMNQKNVDLYVTGSNSKMLSKDVMTEFRDRGDEIHVNPLTFAEFCSAYQGDRRQAWQDFITFGGMPKVMSLQTQGAKSQYLKDLIKKTYLTDVVERNKIQNDITVLDDLLNVVASAVGSLTNPSKLEKTFKSVLGKSVKDTTINTYLTYFEEAYLLSHSQRFDIKGRKYIGAAQKYYFADAGLRNALLNFRQIEETHLMENVIYNELLVRGFNVDVGIVEYNYKDADGKSKRTQVEVDFVVNKINRRYYIQSALSIPNEEKRQQEINSLCRINDAYQRIVVQKEVLLPYYDENGIYYIGVEDFLLKYIDELD